MFSLLVYLMFLFYDLNYLYSYVLLRIWSYYLLNVILTYTLISTFKFIWFDWYFESTITLPQLLVSLIDFSSIISHVWIRISFISDGCRTHTHTSTKVFKKVQRGWITHADRTSSISWRCERQKAKNKSKRRSSGGKSSKTNTSESHSSEIK